MLNPYDIVSVSFWFMTITMLLSTVFLLIERSTVAVNWRLPISIAILVTLLSFIHYYEMKEAWVATQNVSMPFRYLEWVLSFPLQLMGMYFVLQVGAKKDCALLAKMVMTPIGIVSLGFFAELEYISGLWGCLVIVLLWVYLLYELWFGSGDRSMLAMVNLSGRSAYRALRWLVTMGWPIYPLAYYLGSVGVLDKVWTNVLFNEADVSMKILFLTIIWYSAYRDSGLLHSE